MTSTTQAALAPDSDRRHLIPFDLGLPRRLHLVGIGGAGLSGLARILVARGFVLSGADRMRTEFLAQLEPLDVAVEIGESHAGALPAEAEGVVHSAAVPEDDLQLVEARRRGLPCLRYGEALGRLSAAHDSISVAGTHGKTTTSWMLYHALAGCREAARDSDREFGAPGALIGGVHPQSGASAEAPGRAGWLVTEACEYDRTFLRLHSTAAIVTNVEADHIDYYKDFAAVREAFARFLDGVSPDGLVVVGRDVPADVLDSVRGELLRLGVELRLDLVGEHLGCYQLRVRGPGWSSPLFRLAVPGAFNAENAALALGMAVGLAERAGIDAQTAASCAARGLSRFRGVSRRFELWGERRGVEVVHDYAHHPTELRATLAAARRAFPGRPLHALFQPHQYSRTAHFFDEFVRALAGIDRLLICDVYGARAQIDGCVADSAGLVEALRAARVDAHHVADAHAAAVELAAGVPAGGVLLVIGAGDIDQVRDDLLAAL